MATNIFETLGTVTPEGTLQLDQKLTVAPGRVKVRVESIKPPAPTTETLVEFVERTRRELRAAGSHFMNDKQITAWIEKLCADDDRLGKAYQHMEEERQKEKKPGC